MIFKHHLDSYYNHALSQAIKNILATNLVEATIAQLINGLPQADVAWNCQGTFVGRDHPIIDHQEICSGVLDKTRALRDEFDLNTLQFKLCVSTNPCLVKAKNQCLTGELDSGSIPRR